MPSTPTIFSPVTMSRSWIDIFEELDQWDDVEKFYALHARDLNTVQGHRRMCSPKVAHLLALRSGTVQLVHHIHLEDVDDFRSDEEGEIWALNGAGGTASMVFIGQQSAYARRQGEPNDWRTMAEWTSRDDVTQSADRLGGAPTRTTATARRTQATARKGKARSVVTARTRPRRSTTAMTPKMKEYKEGLAKAASSGEDDSDDDAGLDDENVDPAKTSDEVGVVIPNMLPVPAFLAVALMKAYAIDAVSLCLAAIEAIKERATRADEEYKTSRKARAASYVVTWLWNVARDRSDRPNGIRIGPVLNPNADEWSRNCHLKFLAQRVAPPAPTVTEPNSEVWTNLATALSLQAADRTRYAATPTKKGFDAFPRTTQRMILAASEREEDGQMRERPLESYVEIIGLGNAAHVDQHLHYHLRSGLGLDVGLPAGFCSAIKLAAFASGTTNKPDAFSLFSCGPQPLATFSSNANDDDAASHDDLLRMQLKISDSTTGLSDKDVKKLTQVKHVVPRDFHELSLLMKNMAGVTTLVFGSAAPLTSMLNGWVRFITNSDGAVASGLRHLAATDKSAPSRVGWFVDRRIQQYLTACASCDHADLVDLQLFDFREARQQLRDGSFVYPLCPYLTAKLSPPTTSKPLGSHNGNPMGRAGYADDVVTNPQGRIVKITSKDHWQTFIDHAGDAPLPNLCCRYHLNGRCKQGCPIADTHVPLSTAQKAALTVWIAKCRERMPNSNGSGNANKKHKLVGSDHAYFPTPSIDVDVTARTAAVVAQPAAKQPPRSPTASLTRTPITLVAPPPLTISPAPPLNSPSPTTMSDSLVAAVSPDRPDPSTPPQCKSTSTIVSKFVPVPRLLSTGASFPCLPLGRLPALLQAILRSQPTNTQPVDFRFEWSDAAARHNLAVLRRFDLNLAAAIAAQPFSAVTPGSEFRRAALLAPLLSRHPLWPRFHERITKGAAFPLISISDADRRADLAANLARGNHKSAKGHEQKLIGMLKEEVARGWQLPLPKEAALELPGCEVAPLGVVSQWTIDEDGSRIPKLRLTHDQSFNVTKGERRSVNDRVLTDELTPARFGRALMRFLHYVCRLRRLFPTERLLITKVDCKSAYRRVHLQAETAVKACTFIAGILLVALRLTFGGAPNPSQWSDVSETAVDLANDLVRRDDWDPSEWFAPQQLMLKSEKAVDCDEGKMLDDEPLGKAAEMSVTYPAGDTGPMFECYLDDLFGVSRERDRERLEAVLPLVLHLIGRPVETGQAESLPRDALIAVSKFLAEAKASETKVILGWEVNTRRMTVSLPPDKHTAWTLELRSMQSRPTRRVTAKELESTIGRLNHAAYVVPNSRHFLGRLYRAGERAKVHGSVRLTQAQCDDLDVWHSFLDAALKGVSINRLVARWPTRIVRVDACPQGMGGYGLQSGVAWRLRLEPDLVGRASLNTLEFLAALIGLWVECEIAGRIDSDDVILCQGDSSSATGWLAKSSFGDECPVHLAVARTMARFMNDRQLSHYSQWFPGKENSVADSLSRDFHLDDHEVVDHLHNNFAHQLPQSFRLVHLTTAMISDVGDLLRLQHRTQQLPQAPVPSAAAAGRYTRDSLRSSASTATPSSGESIARIDSTCSRASRQPCGKVGPTTPEELWNLALDARRAQFVPPSTAWRRPTGLTNLAVQSTTPEADSIPFWPPN